MTKNIMPVITCGIYLYSTRIKKILICHSTHARWNNWSIPKGIKDVREISFQAASRELKEETGIDLTKIHVMEIYPFPPVKYRKQNKILSSFLVVTDSDLSKHTFICSSLVDKEFPEIDKWKWISPGEIKETLHESQQKNQDTFLIRIKKYQ